MATQVAGQVATRAGRPAVSAGIPVVAAKITAPGVPDWALTRPRITRLIAEGTRWSRLTFVSAPAGSGKTMALSLWAAAGLGRVAWITIDQFDNRPGVFWAHVWNTMSCVRHTIGSSRQTPPSAWPQTS